MIIHNRHFSRSGVHPPKDNAPLVVNADGMMPREFAGEGLQAIAGWNRQVAETTCPVALDELTESCAGYRLKSPVLFTSEQFPGVGIAE